MPTDNLPLEAKTIRTPPVPARPVTDKPPVKPTPTPPIAEPPAPERPDRPERPERPEPTPTPLPSTPPTTTEPAALAKVSVSMGMAPKNFDEGYRMAKAFAESELVPKEYRHKPTDILVAMQWGLEIGLSPMAALQSIAVINGKPTLWGDGQLALIMSSPVYRQHEEYFEVNGHRGEDLDATDLAKDDTAAVCVFWRHDTPLPVTRRFTIAMAKKARLLGKAGSWQEYPDRMLRHRARGFAARDCFPDILRGIRSAEEALDEQEPTPRVVQRISETPAETIAPSVRTSRGGAVLDDQPF